MFTCGGNFTVEEGQKYSTIRDDVLFQKGIHEKARGKKNFRRYY